MTEIKIYDSNYMDIEKIQEDHKHITAADIIEVLFNIVEDEGIDLDEYFY